MSYQYPFRGKMKMTTPFGKIGDENKNIYPFSAYDYDYLQAMGNIRHTIRVWEVAPVLLRADVVKTSLNGVTHAYAVNAGYSWYEDYPLNRQPYSLSILVSEGRVLANNVPHQVAAGCLIVHTDGRVEVKPIADISKEWDVKFAVGGMSICPLLGDIAEGFSGDFADVLLERERVVLGWNAQRQSVIIAAYKAMSAAEGRDLLLELGCSDGITLDGGGSAFMQEAGEIVLKSDGRAQFGCIWLDWSAK